MRTVSKLPALLAALLVLAVLMLPGCAAKNPAEGAAVQREIQFLDSFSFDRKLSASLSAGQDRVDVLFPAAITLNNIPERMDKWLNKVEKFGGKVEIQAESADRGIVSEIIGFFVKVYEMVEESLIYAPAKDYDALITYKPGSGLVTRLSFVRKGVAASADNATRGAPTSAK